MDLIWTIVHWLHIVGAVSAIGGALIMRMVVHPAMMRLDEDARETFRITAFDKFSKFVMHSILVLLVTGVANIGRVHMSGGSFAGLYGTIFLVKVLLALAVFSLSAALIMPSEALAGFQAKRPKWLLINVVLGLIVIFLSAWLRINGAPPRAEDSIPQVPSSSFEAPLNPVTSGDSQQ